MRIVVEPNTIRSATDRDWHFIGPAELLRLHGLPRGTRHVVKGDGFRAQDDDVYLYPRYHGDYPDIGLRLRTQQPTPAGPSGPKRRA
jgi:hypothetical protein